MKLSYSQEELPEVAKSLLELLPVSSNGAVILALKGELGAGKTSLTQAIASCLGVEELVTSPTFVIAKWYKTNNQTFEGLVHVDAYRIESESELSPLGFDDLVKKPKTLIVIEWPEKIPEALEKLSVNLFNIEHEGEKRVIEGPITYERKD